MTLSKCVASMASCGVSPLPCIVTVFSSQTMRSMSSHDQARSRVLVRCVNVCEIRKSKIIRNSLKQNWISIALIVGEIVVGRWLQKYWRRKRSVAIFRLTSSKQRECTTVVAGVDIGTASTSLVSPAVLDCLKNIAPLAGRCVVRNMCSLQQKRLHMARCGVEGCGSFSAWRVTGST